MRLPASVHTIKTLHLGVWLYETACAVHTIKTLDLGVWLYETAWLRSAHY